MRARLVQLLQAVPCSRLHTVEQRCARWMLMCADRTEDDTFELTQECLAEMLGVPHSTVTTVGGTLQHARLIHYRRDTITVLDRRGLEATACECYRIVRDRCGQLLARLPLTHALSRIKHRGRKLPPVGARRKSDHILSNDGF